MTIECDVIKCPSCSHDNAYSEVDDKRCDKYLLCFRCGYTYTINSYKGIYSKEGGRGFYSVRKKQEIKYDMGPISKGTLKSMKEQLKKMEECKYTFKRKGQWYIKDLITNEVLLFSEENLGVIKPAGPKLEKDLDQFITCYLEGRIIIAVDDPDVDEDEVFRFYCEHSYNFKKIFSLKLKEAKEKDGHRPWQIWPHAASTLPNRMKFDDL